MASESQEEVLETRGAKGNEKREKFNERVNS
jgi:hypothetical protein